MCVRACIRLYARVAMRYATSKSHSDSARKRVPKNDAYVRHVFLVVSTCGTIAGVASATQRERRPIRVVYKLPAAVNSASVICFIESQADRSSKEL